MTTLTLNLKDTTTTNPTGDNPMKYATTNVTTANFNGIAINPTTSTKQNNEVDTTEITAMNTATQPTNEVVTTSIDTTEPTEFTNEVKPTESNIVILKDIEFDLSKAKKDNGRYTEEFKANVVKVKTELGATHKEVTDSLGIPQKSTSDWCNKVRPVKVPSTPAETLQAIIDNKKARLDNVKSKISEKVKLLMEEEKQLESEILNYQTALCALNSSITV